MKKFLLIALVVFLVATLSGCINHHNGDNHNNGDNGMPEFTQIGSTDDCAFWSCIPFGDKIYFGTYGYPKGYSYPPWTHLKNFAAGESIPRMTIFGGTIYCVTENQGKIYRMNSPTDWVVVHDDAWPYGLGIASLGNYIYASFNTSGQTETRILYSSNGTSWSTGDDWIGGEITVLVAYNGKVYALGSKGNKIWARRGTTTSWANVGALCSDSIVGNWRMGLAFGGYLYLGMGDRTDGKTKVYRFDGTNLSGELFSISTYYVHDACIHNNEMYWLFGPHMNSGSPGSVTYHLYKSPTGEPGTWSLVKSFTTNRKSSHGKYRTRGCVGSVGGSLYVGVQDKVYKMSVVPVAEALSEKTIGCSTCGSTAKVTISSIAGNNAQVLCPVCEAPLSERAVKAELIAEGQLVKELRGRIEALDERKVELEKQIALVRIQIAEAEELIGF